MNSRANKARRRKAARKMRDYRWAVNMLPTLTTLTNFLDGMLGRSRHFMVAEVNRLYGPGAFIRTAYGLPIIDLEARNTLVPRKPIIQIDSKPRDDSVRLRTVTVRVVDGES